MGTCDHNALFERQVQKYTMRWDTRYGDVHYVLVPATVAAILASSAAATAVLTFLPSFHLTRGGGSRFRRPSRDRTRTTRTIHDVEPG